MALVPLRRPHRTFSRPRRRRPPWTDRSARPSRRAARRVRRVRRVRTRVRGRPARLLRALRAPAPRPGVRGHRDLRGRPHHDRARPRAGLAGVRRAEAQGPHRLHGARATCATPPPAPRPGRTPSRSTARTAARSPWPTTATSSTRSSCTPSCRTSGVQFRSTSDSEIIAALLSTHEADTIEEALADVMPQPRGRVLDGRDDRGLAWSPSATAPACGRCRSGASAIATASPPRAAPSTSSGPSCCARSSRARWCSIGERGIDHQAARGLAAQGVLRVRAHLLRAARLDPRGQPHAGLTAQDGRDPVARGAGRGRRGDRGARLRQRGGRRLRQGVRAPARRRADQEPLRGPHLHPARPGAAQARPADEVQPAREVVEGKRLVVVDDSIVRGNTTRQIVSMLRDAGALEVHMRISAPPIRYPVPLRDRHVDQAGDGRPRAHRRGDRRPSSAATRVAYLSLEGVYEAIRGRARHPLRRLLLRRLPARAHRRRQRQVRARGAHCRCGVRRAPTGRRASTACSTWRATEGVSASMPRNA